MSHYFSHPDIPPAKINAYPKRRRKQPDILIFETPTPKSAPTLDNVRYADFFTPELAQRKITA